MFAVGNGPKSRCDEIRISKVILRTGDNKQTCNIGGCQNSFTLYIMIAMACSRRILSVGSFALCRSSSYVDLLSQ